MKIKGEVKKIIYASDDSDYKVFQLVSDNTIYKICGDIVTLLEGEYLEVEIEKMHHNKYGEQYRLNKYNVSVPDSLDLIIKYLSAPFFPGIGPATAKNIVMRFGKETFNIIEKEPYLLEQVPGISQKKAQAIHDAYKKEFKDKEAHQFLVGLDISPTFIHKIIEKYQDSTVTVITENPYRMIRDIDGIGFKKADEIARKIGFDVNSPYRIRAIIQYILHDIIIANGHTCVDKETLLNDIMQNYLLPIDCIDDILLNEYNYLLKNNEIVETEIVQEDGEKSVFVSSKYYYRHEKEISKSLKKLQDTCIIIPGDIEKDISFFEEANNIKFHSDQKLAIINALGNKVSIITGGPGTGKTTIIKCLVDILEKHYRKIALCAPTGRAAKRIEESTSHGASTIHRLLGVIPTGEGVVYMYNKRNPLPFDFIIIDETSMCDAEIIYYLTQAVPSTAQVIFIGDKDQLPSVGAGNFLADIIESDCFSVSNLSKIYRQGENSLIIKNAHKVNKGEMLEFSENGDFQFLKIREDMDVMEEIIGLIKHEIPNRYGYDIDSIQVLSAMKAGTLGVINLNKEIQRAVNAVSRAELNIKDNWTFKIGDRVMNIKNRYDLEWQSILDDDSEKGVFNGEIGEVIDINQKEKIAIVLYDKYRKVIYKEEDLSTLTLSYAISIHKSQGSEFPAVILVVENGRPQILNRRTIYTGLTRAKNLVYVVSKERIFHSAVKTTYTLKRNTLLKYFLTHSVMEIPR